MSTEKSLEGASTAGPSPATSGPRLSFAAPLIIAVIISIALAIGMTLNPKDIPSVLIGSPVPDFDLPPVQGRTLGLSSANLKGEVSVVNVWASWCTECKKEHPLMMTIEERSGVPLHGINYKDRPTDAANWLDSLGDPYTRSGADFNGRVSIDWGVYGVPETFVINKKGEIAYKLIGRITEKELNDTILPLIDRLKSEGS